MGEWPPATRARALVRRSRSAALATALIKDATHPYASFVTIACDQDGSPIVLLSDLSDHSRNLKADPRASLLVEAASHLANPQAGPRVTLMGRLERSDEDHHRRRFLARHPAAAAYAGFGDFHVYRMTVTGAHLIGGFADARWITTNDLAPDACAAVADCEAAVLTHMNADHGEALALYATALLGQRGGRWRMTGIDPEGIDLALGKKTWARLDFESPVGDAEACRRELARLAKRVRGER